MKTHSRFQQNAINVRHNVVKCSHSPLMGVSGTLNLFFCCSFSIESEVGLKRDNDGNLTTATKHLNNNVDLKMIFRIHRRWKEDIVRYFVRRGLPICNFAPLQFLYRVNCNFDGRNLAYFEKGTTSKQRNRKKYDMPSDFRPTTVDFRILQWTMYFNLHGAHTQEMRKQI